MIIDNYFIMKAENGGFVFISYKTKLVTCPLLKVF